MHVLDNAAWHALTGPHATLAQRVPLAARYLPDVSVFAALPDEATDDAWDGLRDLLGPGGAAVLARNDLTLPDGWSVIFTQPCRQMWLRGDLAPDGRADDPIAGHQSQREFLRLDGRDAREMLALVKRTEPGPFVARTVELGTYLGVRDDGALVAMAGERLHPPGFTEISAVCTDATHRGRGLASRLVRAIVEGIWARGETPMLHMALENEPAHRIYSALGFETRTNLDVIGVRAPA
jgi:ribosomal protein S18 acetylase RimI-like enzyme